jgi:hypothetical protein
MQMKSFYEPCQVYQHRFHLGKGFKKPDISSKAFIRQAQFCSSCFLGVVIILNSDISHFSCRSDQLILL